MPRPHAFNEEPFAAHLSHSVQNVQSLSEVKIWTLHFLQDSIFLLDCRQVQNFEHVFRMLIILAARVPGGYSGFEIRQAIAGKLLLGWPLHPTSVPLSCASRFMEVADTSVVT